MQISITKDEQVVNNVNWEPNEDEVLIVYPNGIAGIGRNWSTWTEGSDAEA